MSVITVSLSQGASDGFTVFEAHSDLTEGSLKGVRAKFSEAGERAALEQVIDEIDYSKPGRKLYLGDFRKGEIQIIGIARIIRNRFWMEIEYQTRFPATTKCPEGPVGTYRVVRWNTGVANGAAVLGITRDGKCVFVKEFKHAIRQWSVHLPRGLRKRLPNGRLETLRACGLREIGEEAGVKPTADSQVFDLGPIFPDSGALASKPRLLAVTNVEVDPSAVSLDVSEAISGTVVVDPSKLRDLLPKMKPLAPLSADDEALGEAEGDQADNEHDFADSFTGDSLFRAHVQGLINLKA